MNQNMLLSLSDRGVIVRSIDGQAWLLSWDDVRATLGCRSNERVTLHASPDGGWIVHVGLGSQTYSPGKLEEELRGSGTQVIWLIDGKIHKDRSCESDYGGAHASLHEAADDALDGNELCAIVARSSVLEDEYLASKFIERIYAWLRYDKNK